MRKRPLFALAGGALVLAGVGVVFLLPDTRVAEPVPVPAALSEGEAEGAGIGTSGGPIGVRCSSAADPDDQAPLICRGDLSPDGPELLVHLLWAPVGAEGEEVDLSRLELYRAGDAAPFQTIETDDARLHGDLLASSVELVDVNFDGWADLRLMVAGPPPPPVPGMVPRVGATDRRHATWLWNPQAGAFEPTPLLDEIVGLQVRAQDRQLVGFAQPEPNVFRIQAWHWLEEDLEPVWRRTDSYSDVGTADSRCEQLREIWRDGGWIEDGVSECY